MPVRFRCPYCNQLLGISRRKAGQVVRCPTCAGQVVVPSPDGEDEPKPGPGHPPTSPFEGMDFEAMMQAEASSAGTSSPQRVVAPTEHRVDIDNPYDAPALAPPPKPAAAPPPPAPPAGVFLSPAKATLLTVLVIIALALAFGAGLVTGMFFRS
jgi:hypothetical protein